MSLTGILIGLLNVAIVVAVLLLIGAICVWVLGALGWPPPVTVQKGYLAVVALIALVLIIQLLLGIPRINIVATGWVLPVSA